MYSKILRTLAVMLVLLLTLLALSFYLLGNDALVRKELSRQVFNVSGWRLEIHGPFQVDWGRQTRVHASQLQLSNPQWPDHPLMFKSDELLLLWQPLKLWGGEWIFDDLQLGNCRLHFLEQDQSSNWQPRAKPQPEPHEVHPETGISWQVWHLGITNCQIDVQRQTQEQSLEIQLDEAQLQVGADNTLNANIKGALDQQPLSLEGDFQPVTAFWLGGPLRHELQMQAGQNILQSAGTFDDLKLGAGADLQFRFSGPEFNQITKWLDWPQIGSGAFDAKLDLNTQSSGLTELNLSGDFGQLQIKGSGHLDRLIQAQSGDIELQVDGPDLAAMGQLIGQDWLLPQPFRLALQADIQQGKTDLESLLLQTGEERISAHGVLGPRPAMLGSELSVELHSPELLRWQSGGLDEAFKGINLFGPLHARLGITVNQQAELQLDAEGELGANRFSIQSSMKLQSAGTESATTESSGESSTPIKLASGHKTSIKLESASLHQFGRLLGQQSWPDQPFRVQADLQSLDRGLKFTINDGALADLRFQMRGEIPDLQQPLSMKSHIDLSVPSAKMAEFLLPDSVLPDLPLAIKGEMVHAGSSIRVPEASVQLGESQAQLAGVWQMANHHQGSTASFQIKGKNLRELWPAAPAELELSPFELSGDWLRQSDGDYVQGLQADLGRVNLLADGRLATGSWYVGSDLQVQLSGADAAQFNALGSRLSNHFDGHFFAAEPFDLQFHLKGETSTLAFEDIHVQLGKSAITGQLQLDLPVSERSTLRGSLRSQQLDAAHWQSEAIASSLRAKQQEETQVQETQAPSSATPRFFSDQPFNLQQASPLNLDLDLEIGRVLLNQGDYQQIKLGLKLDSDSLQLQPFEFKASDGGYYVGQLSSKRSEGGSSLDLKMRAEQLKLGFIGLSGMDSAKLSPSDFVLDLSGRGSTRRELAQTLEGQLRWYQGSGWIARSGLDFVFADLLSVLMDALNPLATKESLIHLNCAVFAADFSNGLVHVEPIVFQTDQITAFSEGKIDLLTEEIDLSFNTIARKGLGLSAGNVVNPFFKIGGTLMKPALQLDVTKGAIGGGAMFATAGLSVLFKSVSKRLLASKDPCGDARKALQLRDEKDGMP